ncbi:MAG: caspase family protein [Ignavibacteriales bacterium]|nr:caspase family protein [Ignavibacteriales bacterium]
MKTLDQPTSEKRTALVIGNANYKQASLKNPINDARAMANALRNVGFEVLLRENLNRRDMVDAITEFGGKIQRGGTGLFYYAGHGMQMDGKNYLLPIGAAIEKKQDAEFEAVDVGRVLGEMDNARNRVNIVVLDACRDNPFARSWRSTTAERGLAFMNAPSGTYIAYATAPGEVAADGDGKNGLYTQELLAQIQTP